MTLNLSEGIEPGNLLIKILTTNTTSITLATEEKFAGKVVQPQVRANRTLAEHGLAMSIKILENGESHHFLLDTGGMRETIIENSKIFGLSFGKYKIFDKTLEGTLAYVGCALICGYFISNILDMPFILLILGGIAAALAEVFSFKIDDNFTVALISGSVMTAVLFFLALV